MDNEVDTSLSYEETLRLRHNFISGSCHLHFNQSPVRIQGSEGQYLISDSGKKYLDCGSRISNVGHCHPRVVSAGTSGLATLAQGDMEGCVLEVQQSYATALLSTLPPKRFQTCLFTNSGSEANELALLLARQYTGRHGVAVMESAFHGATSLLVDISPKTFKQFAKKNSSRGKPAWVHVLPLPDMYRGKHATDPEAAEKYLQEAKAVLERGCQGSGEIACFISEPVLAIQGMILPPQRWLQGIYSHIRSLGGVVIADEVQTGLGRSGSHMWACQAQGALPDILTVGKPIANGFPLGVVITSRKIAASIAGYDLKFRCEPVGAAVGLAVLDILHEERLLQNALDMGRLLHEKMTELMTKFRNIGDVRSTGLMVGVDIVWDKESRKPAKKLAETISYRMKDEMIIVANEGEYENVLIFMPALSVTAQQVETAATTLERVLAALELEDSDDIYEALNGQPGSSGETSSGFVCTDGEPRAGTSGSGSGTTLQPFPSDSSDSNDSSGSSAPIYDTMD